MVRSDPIQESDTRNVINIGVVGAGISGLACADALVAAGRRVVLFDKGRAPGGRMATRRIATAAGEAAFDHGAQYFTARDPAFQQLVLTWQEVGLAAPWPAAGPDAWVGVPSMAAPVRAIGQRHAVRFPVQIDRIAHDGRHWQLGDEAFDSLVVALPAEQAAALLRTVHPRFADAAERTVSAPCWTVMAAYAAPLPAPDLLREAGPIGWAARNNAKPGRGGPEAWVVQAGPDWSRAQLERSPDEIVPLLLEALATRLGHPLPTPLAATAHRWRYARSGAHGSGSLWDRDLQLGVCGDWLLGPRVEAAWLSGTALAGVMLERSAT